MYSQQKIKLFCVPYAGGSSTIYYPWRKLVAPFVELNPIELSGRGKRFNEPLYNNLDNAIEDVAGIISKNSDSYPYALFGHSMGATIALEVVPKLRQKNVKEPIHVFLSGIKPPHIKERDTMLHSLPEDLFKKKLLSLGGTPVELFEDREFFELFEPIIRSDFKNIAEHVYSNNYQLECNISCMFGKEEDITYREMAEWDRYTIKQCAISELNGGHFFINSDTASVVEIVNRTLSPYAK